MFSHRSGLLHRTVASVFCALAVLAPLTTTAVDTKPGLVMVGSTTLVPVARQLADSFLASRRGSSIIVRGGGSGEGFRALLAGEAQVANSSRFISAEEFGEAARRGVYPVAFRIAQDCIIPIVHKDNPVRGLSLDQLRGIYTGEITNWRQLGGRDRAINVLTRGADSGTFGVWRDLVMRGEAVQASATGRDSSREMLRTVNKGHGAIGYISLAHLSANVKPLRVDGVMGSLSSVNNGSYPINRSLFLFTLGWPRGELLELINYALHPEQGQRVVSDAGLLSLY